MSSRIRSFWIAAALVAGAFYATALYASGSLIGSTNSSGSVFAGSDLNRFGGVGNEDAGAAQSQTRRARHYAALRAAERAGQDKPEITQTPEETGAFAAKAWLGASCAAGVIVVVGAAAIWRRNHRNRPTAFASKLVQINKPREAILAIAKTEAPAKRRAA